MPNEIRIRADVDDRATKKVAAIEGRFGQLMSNKGFQSITQGVGMGVGIGAWGLLSKGISTAIDFMGDAAQMAKDDEASVAHMTTALNANLAGWQAHSGAIDRAIKAGQKLAFTDDETRDSLAALSPATHSVTEAIHQMQVAQNLARFGQMSLADATGILIKNDVGSTRALKSLGIETDATMSATDRLNKIEAVTIGQSAAYIGTTKGKQAAEADRLKELQESLGKDFFVPVQVAALDFFSTLLDDVEMVNDYFGHLDGTMTDFERNIRDGISDADNAFNAAEHTIRTVDTAVKTVTGDVAKSHPVLVNAKSDWGHLTDALSDFYGLASVKGREAQLARDLDKDTAGVKALHKALQDGKITLQEQATLQDKYSIAVDAGNPKVKERTQLLDIQKGKVADDKDALIALSVEEAKLGKSKGLKDWINGQIDHWTALTQAEQDAVTAAQNYVHYKPGGKFKGHPGKAAGGPVSANEGYIVGEKGPEFFMPQNNGTIIPATQTAGMGGGGMNINLTLASFFPPSMSQAQQAARAFVPELAREMRRQHIID